MHAKRFIFILLVFITTIDTCHSNIDILTQSLTALKDNLITLQKTLKPEKKKDKWLDRDVALKEFAALCKEREAENKKIPDKTDKILRIMTYNVHAFEHPRIKGLETDGDIYQIVADLKPDIFVFQEQVTWHEKKTIKYFASLGYASNNTINHDFSNHMFWKKNIKIKGKVPTEQYYETKRRRYIALPIEINGTPITIYGTHLDDKDKKLRQSAAEQLVKMTNDTKNVIIMGDFNAKYDDEALGVLRSAGYQHCFALAKLPLPGNTHWAKKTIDFILMKSWDLQKLPIAGCYIYYTSLSDHLPIILDIDVSPLGVS